MCMLYIMLYGMLYAVPYSNAVMCQCQCQLLHIRTVHSKYEEYSTYV